MDELTTILLLLFAVLALLASIGWMRAVGRIRRGNARRQRVASEGERAAVGVLQAQGYQVVDRQVTGRWSLWVDGHDLPVHSRADLLVARGGRRFVAEIKTGDLAVDPTRPATRRQLLEYLLAFDVAGVLLVDMVQGTVHEVRFPDLIDTG